MESSDKDIKSILEKNSVKTIRVFDDVTDMTEKFLIIRLTWTDWSDTNDKGYPKIYFKIYNLIPNGEDILLKLNNDKEYSTYYKNEFFDYRDEKLSNMEINLHDKLERYKIEVEKI